jgi:hypothetical protein
MKVLTTGVYGWVCALTVTGNTGHKSGHVGMACIANRLTIRFERILFHNHPRWRYALRRSRVIGRGSPPGKIACVC